MKSECWKKYPDEILKKFVAESASLYEVIRKLNASTTSGALYRHLTKRIEIAGIDRSHFKTPSQIRATNMKLQPEEIFVYNRRNGLREKSAILKSAMLADGFSEVCECGQGKIWNGQPLKMTIDHIDGDCLNNIKTNLRFLCPNCHSQTNTFGYKGKK